jgi:phage terminase large subunit-like protein
MSDLESRRQKLRRYKQLKTEASLLFYKPYPKQKEFHELPNRERALFAANRVGKTYAAGYETAMHATGFYPDWWKGRRFEKPVRWGVGSETGDLLKKGPQRILMGPITAIGTGSIPKGSIKGYKMAKGITDGMDSVQVHHTSGGVSELVFMSYADGREKWQSDEWDGAWLDEEPPLDIYTEALTRTNTRMGPILLTFTPLKGVSDVVMRFIKKEADCGTIGMTLDDAGHFTPEQREEIVKSYPAHEREARTKGIPMLGKGKIFQHSEESLKIEPFTIPRHFALIGGMDFGIDHPFAASKVAYDRDTDTIFVTQIYKERGLTPVGHASALRRWGNLTWAWPHDGLARDKQSGKQLAQFYRDEGLNLLSTHAQYPDERGNGLEASILDLDQRMGSGRFKVFSHLEDFFEEYRFYYRTVITTSDGGKRSVPIKERDDVISSIRYAVMCLNYAEVEQALPKSDRYRVSNRKNHSWMAA